MAVYADRVKETTTTTGTGTYSLDGAAAGFRTFVAGVGTGVLVTYACENGTDWEIGEGTITDATPDTLSRTTILASSNAGAAVNWAAGTKNIFLTAAAARTVFTDKDNTLTGRTFVPAGSLSSPSIAFSTDTDLGIYRSAANSLAVSAGTSSSTPALLVTGENSNICGVQIAGFSGGFPDIIANGTATDLNLGVYSKGTGYVAIGTGAGSANVALFSRGASATATHLLFSHNTGYTDIELVASSGTASLDISAYGGAVGGGFNFYTYSSAYRQLFKVGPDSTISGVQNYLAIYSTNTGGSPYIVPAGGDANINLTLYGKGTGGIRICGTTTTFSGTGALSTSEVFTHSGSTAHTVSTTGAVTFTGAVVQSTKGFAAAEYSAGSGAPGTITWSNGQNQVRTLTSSGTMTFASPTAGVTYKLRIVQGGSGSYTITWPTIKWAGGAAPTLSTTVGAIDIVTLYYNGTDYFGQAAVGFA
jgi:hypothetical protein